MSRAKSSCCGLDIYNYMETSETVSTITTYVGGSTSIGPKVAVKTQKTISYAHRRGQVIGTIDASIYEKNSFQDNTKYIINKKEDNMINNTNPTDILKQALGNGKDVLWAIDTAESLLRIVSSGVMSMEEAVMALGDIRRSLVTDAEKTKGSEETDSHIPNADRDSEDEDGEEICVVRRLTPTETARLQGFPDDYTKIDGIETADAPQYKAHGNSWATPCANFVSVRVEMELRRLGHEGTINYATCCSGIEAHSVSVRGLDWKSIFFSEIEPFPCRVLATHYPTVPNLGDMTQIHFDGNEGVITNSHAEGEEYSLPSCFKEAPIQKIPFKVGDLQVFSGGTPCQSISVAGKREGMAEGSGTRSSLAFHYQRIIDETKPTFTIWENVPGAFSSNGGADFIWFVNKCAESGYAMAWRVLDAQWTMTEEFPRAVPQRRRRIWLVGYKGNDWRIPARIVFELDKNLTSNPPTRVPGLGFKSLIEESKEGIAKIEQPEGASQNDSDNLMGLLMESDDGRKDLLKVSQMIDFSEMPEETDFSKVSMAEIYEFARKIGEPGYIGSVFRTDKKKKKVKMEEPTMDLFSMLDAPQQTQDEEKEDGAAEESEEWVGAEKITPAILESIGNAGLLSNGRICTMNCHEWIAGIQLSPKTYGLWEEFVKYQEWLKANELLPKAYDETVCGLSDVLQDDPDEKYNLSWRACFGILRRAESRGKELPSALAIALVSTIRENASIVKWVALNGKDTKKKETDLSEKESAMLCFNKFIAEVAKFEDIEAMPPKGKNESDEEEEIDEDDIEMDDDGNPILPDEEFGEPAESKAIHVESAAIPEMPNGCINEGGGEVSPTIVSSQFKGPGNTQDGTVVAVRK